MRVLRLLVKKKPKIMPKEIPDTRFVLTSRSLKEAKRKGCDGVFNGLGMLLYQGVLAFKIWLDTEPPIEVMEEALREVLTK